MVHAHDTQLNQTSYDSVWLLPRLFGHPRRLRELEEIKYRLFRVQRGDGIGMPSLRYQIRRSGIPMPEFPAEAGRAETFNPRSFRFYKRLGFAPVESQLEPVTASEYWIMLRPPNGPIA